MRGRSHILSLAGVLILPAIWILVSDVFQLVNPLLLPPFAVMLKRLGQLLTSGSLFTDLGFTMWRWCVGFSSGVACGVLAGLLLGLSARGRKLFEFPVEFFRAMPATAIFPLYLIVFGIGDASKIAMAFTPTFLLMLVNTSYGVTLAEPARRRMAAVFGATKLQTFRHVVVRDALPQIFIGLRLSASLSLIVVVVSEMFIGTDFGLGQRVFDSYLTNSVSTLYALLIVLGTVGYALNKFLVHAERRAVYWV